MVILYCIQFLYCCKTFSLEEMALLNEASENSAKLTEREKQAMGSVLSHTFAQAPLNRSREKQRKILQSEYCTMPSITKQFLIL